MSGWFLGVVNIFVMNFKQEPFILMMMIVIAVIAMRCFARRGVRISIFSSKRCRLQNGAVLVESNESKTPH